MFESVLRQIVFRRSTRVARALLFLLALGVAGVVAGAAFAGPTGPTVVELRTADGSGDGYIDAIVITFDTPMDTSVANPAGFSVAGYELRTPPAGQPSQWLCPNGSCALPTTQLQLNLVPRLDIVNGDTAAFPAVTYVAPATGGAKAAGTGAAVTGPIPVTKDGAKPALVRVTGSDFDQAGLFNVPADRMDFSFSEPVRLVGATAADRHLSLERAIKFSQGAGSQCQSADGDGVNIHSFPRAGSGASALDPIVVPAKPSQEAPTPSSRYIRVMMQPDAGSTGTTGTNFLSNIPGICKAGVDNAGANNITDAASPANPAASQDFPNANVNRRDINVADAELVFNDNKPALYTRDLLPDPGNGAPKGDGILDAIEVVFDHEIIDSSVTEALTSQFAVFSGAQAATISSVTTPSGSDAIEDASVFLHLTNVEWDGQTKPKVWFNPGSACTLRTKIPTPTYYACAAEFGIVEGVPTGIDALDKVAPVLQTVSTMDTSPADGIINRVELRFNEPVDETSTASGWTIGGATATAIDVVDADRKIVLLDFGPGTTPNTGTTPAVAYATQVTGGTIDADGNQIGAGSLNAIDGAAPVLSKATSFDVNGDGRIDTVTFEFSEAVDQALATAANFFMDGAAANAFGTSPIDATNAATDSLVTVTSDPQVLGTGRVEAKYEGTSLADLAPTPQAAATKTIPEADVVDAAKPVATISTTPQSPLKAGTIGVRATFTEIMDTAVAPTVAVGTKSVAAVPDDPDHNATGWVDSAPNAGLIWDGTVELTAAECDAENGCALEVTLTGGTDPSANTTADLTPVAVVLDANAPEAATVENVSAVQNPGFAPIAANTIGSNTTQLNLTAAIVAGEVNEIGETSGGSAEIVRFDGTSDQPLSPAARIENISASASQVSIQTAFASPAALQTALAEGTHLLKVKLCDGAAMCTTSSGVSVVADYSPVPVSLDSPNSGTLQGNSKACITWNADETNTSLQSLTLRYAIDGAAPTVIATGLPADGAGACDGSGTAYGWTVPLINTNALRVQALTLDSFNNEGIAASSENITVQTTYVLTHIPSTTVIVSGGAVTYSGTLKGNNVPVTGRGITIQRKLRGQTAWQSIITNATTNASGAFSWTGRPGSTADYRAVSASGGGYPTVTSSTTSVAVRVLVNFAQSATSLRRGQFVTLSGATVPAKGGKKVQLLMLSGGKWVKVAEQVVWSGGGYRFTYRLTTAGTRTFKVYYAAQDIYHAGNSSINRNVAWR